jgi:ornithine carbamoyltransferase
VRPTRQERQGEEQQRLHLFRPYQLNGALVKLAKPECIVMHRLPANRGEEITTEVLDGRQSVALVQARNRVQIQKAVMVKLLA